MAEELLPYDVEQYTRGKLSQTDPETVRALDAALDKARRFCGWHVTPVRTETITLDATNGPYLILPTLKIVTLTSVTENGTVITSEIKQSADAPGVLARNNWRGWGGVYGPMGSEFGAISVTYTHGYTAAEAAGFREAVLRMIDVASMQIGSGGDGPLEEMKVDDVSLRWSRTGPDRLVDAIARNPMDASALYQYRIFPI